ncbi:MAG TPA: cytochrome C, partial [Casimicrobium sp.]|nr:cytochrome C [Casimicrobium sp.]
MKLKFIATLAVVGLAVPAFAQEAVTYRTKIAPMIKALCVECHGSTSPSLAEFKLAEEKYT